MITTETQIQKPPPQTAGIRQHFRNTENPLPLAVIRKQQYVFQYAEQPQLMLSTGKSIVEQQLQAKC